MASSERAPLKRILVTPQFMAKRRTRSGEAVTPFSVGGTQKLFTRWTQGPALELTEEEEILLAAAERDDVVYLAALPTSATVDFDAAETLDSSARPTDLDALDLFGHAEPEVHPLARLCEESLSCA